MTYIIAEMLINQMEEMKTDHVYYRGQKVSKIYIKRYMWKCNCYEDHRRAMKSASKTMILQKVR